MNRFLPSRGPRSVNELVIAHYQSIWGRDRVKVVDWTPEHMAVRLPDLQLAKIAPEKPGGMWTFATVGAWHATEEADHGIEFLAVARSEDVAVMERLGRVAFYHAGPLVNRLGLNHTGPIGEGWVEGSPLDAFLISLPYLWGPQLEHCQLPDRHIQVLWVIPISEAERVFARTHGVDALETRFEETKFEYLNPFRASVVPDSA